MKDKYGYSRYFRSLQILADFTFINVFYIVLVRYTGYGENFNVRTLLDINLIWGISALFVNPYQVYRYSGYAKLFLKQVYTLILFLMLSTLFHSYFLGKQVFSGPGHMSSIAAFAGLFLTWKLLLIAALILYRKSGRNKRNFTVIGSGKLVEDFIKEMTKSKALGYHYLGTLHSTKNTPVQELLDAMEGNSWLRDAHMAYICLPSIKESGLNAITASLEQRKIHVRIILDFRSSMARKGELEFVDYIPVLNFISDPLDSITLSVKKRLFDVLFSLLVIVLLSPLFVLVAVITGLSSKGPIFYRQQRVGRLGRQFTMYKFRSMYNDSERDGPALSSGNDARITPWGRFMRRYRIDELPQFLNVLFGSMSVVGPRPEREFWRSQITEKSPQYSRLSYVKPGITSLGQVKFGYAENLREMRKRLRYDLLYLNNMSIWMDLKIIALTLSVVLRGEGK